MAKSSNRFPSSRLSAADLREFRSRVSQLKKQGLVPSYVDARSAQPHFVRGGKTLREVVNKSYKSEPKPVSKSASKSPTKAAPKPKPVKLAPLGSPITVRDLKLGKHKSLAGFLRDLEDNEKAIDALKRPEERFGFQINGTDSIAIFSDIGLMLEYLRESAGIQKLLTKRGDGKEVYDTLKIIRWNKGSTAWYKQRKIRGLTPGQLARQARYQKKKRGNK